MFFECIAIIVLIVTMFFLYLRMGKRGMALTILPLVTIPAVHVLGLLLTDHLSLLFSVPANTLLLVCDLFALALSMILTGCFSVLYEIRYRTVYLIIAGLFDVILTSVLIINL